VKKGQFLAPEDMKNAIEKLAAAGCDHAADRARHHVRLWRLVVDMRGLW
jgi:3-deoxy-D-manno-octulosonic acid (KDO) 8-phosphate synthase